MKNLPPNMDILAIYRKTLSDSNRKVYVAVGVNYRTYNDLKEGLRLKSRTEVSKVELGLPIVILPRLPNNQVRFYKTKEALDLDRAVFNYKLRDIND